MADETAAGDLAAELARAETKLREAVSALRHLIRAYEKGGMTAAIERAEAAVSEADRPKQWITGHVSGPYSPDLDQL
jgi:multidrug resistance efflux pump